MIPEAVSENGCIFESKTQHTTHNSAHMNVLPDCVMFYLYI